MGKLKKGLNKEFEWDGHLVVIHECIEKVIGLIHKMKKVKIEKVMGLWSCTCASHIYQHSWMEKFESMFGWWKVHWDSFIFLPSFLYMLMFYCLLRCNCLFSRVLIMISWLGWCVLWEVNELSSRPCPWH